jgi:hypothetical protein
MDLTLWAVNWYYKTIYMTIHLSGYTGLNDYETYPQNQWALLL